MKEMYNQSYVVGNAISHSIRVSCGCTPLEIESVLTVRGTESTLKRHGYYCRSRKAGGTTRIRSCVACAKRKARCDSRRPECTRCLTKSIECHYPPKSSKGIEPRLQCSRESQTVQREVTPSLVIDPSIIETGQEASNNGVPIIPDVEFSGLGDNYINWNNTDIDFADFLDPTMNDETFQYPSPADSSVVRRPTPPTNQTAQAQQTSSSSSISIPAIPNLSVRSLIQRPKTNPGSQRTINLILHTLKSYPRMMLRKSTLPPFIHPRFISSDTENGSMEPLTNCISLLHMISSGVQGSRKLFWKNVRLECEKLIEDVGAIHTNYKEKILG